MSASHWNSETLNNESLVFVINPPFKSSLVQLPCCMCLSISMVRKKVPKMLQLPNGVFKALSYETASTPYIYMFQPDVVTDCKSLTEEDVLPYSCVPTTLPPLKNEVMNSPGLTYFLGLEHAEYVVQENGVTIPNSQTSIPLLWSEQARMDITDSALDEYFTKKNYFSSVCFEELPKSGTFCPYSGGADTVVIGYYHNKPANSLKGMKSAVLFNGNNLSEKDCFAQLQAFMLQCATKELVEKLKEYPEEAKNVTKLICYGLNLVSLPSEPVHLLRLTINFESEETNYELLSVFNGVNSFAFIDRAINYITSNM